MYSKYVTKATEIDKPEFILVYGRPGSGKTHFAGGALDVPGFKKGLYIDVEGSSVGVLKDERWDIIRVDKYPDKERLQAIADAQGVDPSKVDLEAERFKFLNTLMGRGPQGLFNPANDHGYDVIVLDTFDAAQDWSTGYFVDGPGATKTNRGEVDTWAGWGEVKNWSMDLAYRMKQTKPLAIMVVHDREEKTKSGAVVQLLRMSGAAKDLLPGVPDVVVYLDRKVEDEEYVTYGYFGTNDGKVTKDRFNFPPVVKNVTIPQLFKFIDKKQEKQ